MEGERGGEGGEKRTKMEMDVTPRKIHVHVNVGVTTCTV